MRATLSRASLVALSFIFFSFNLYPTSASCKSATALRFSLESDSKIIVSSRRLMNSGRNWAFHAFIILALTISLLFGSPVTSRISDDPILDVKITTVSVKSTFLP